MGPRWRCRKCCYAICPYAGFSVGQPANPMAHAVENVVQTRSRKIAITLDLPSFGDGTLRLAFWK